MRLEVYRVAYEEANAELKDIVGKFEELRVRKEQIEKAVEVLKVLVGPDGQAEAKDQTAAEQPSYTFQQTTAKPSPHPAQPAAEPAPEPIRYVPEPTPEPVPYVAEQSSDPFQRRIDQALGRGVGARELREYSRLFNGGQPLGK